MYREAVEGPEAVRRTVTVCKDAVEVVAEALREARVKRGFVVGSGTSFHASLYLQYLLNKYTDLHVTAIPASEFRAWRPTRGTYLVIGFSQSGESSDVVEAIREAKRLGALTICITNTPGSTLTRLAEYSIVTRAGEEKAVAATKTFDVQLAASVMITRAILGEEYGDLLSAAMAATRVVEREDLLRELASKLRETGSTFILGRGATYPVALEFALKLKEASMIHAEGFAVREFLHGPLQLVDESTPLYVLIGSRSSYEESRVGLERIKSYKPNWVYIGPSTPKLGELFSEVVEVEDVGEDVAVLPIVKAAQLIAYYASIARGLNPDKPTKLSKVVKYS